jgi:hypothetical protein
MVDVEKFMSNTLSGQQSRDVTRAGIVKEDVDKSVVEKRSELEEKKKK